MRCWASAIYWFAHVSESVGMSDWRCVCSWSTAAHIAGATAKQYMSAAEADLEALHNNQ